MRYRSIKTYGHEIGLSCAFRQWRAQSHCSRLHGYPLAFRFVFEAQQLDENGWVIDFGALTALKAQLHSQFDHKTVVAANDPHLREFRLLHSLEVIDLRIVLRTGCEAFARQAHKLAEQYLRLAGENDRVQCVEVECREHGGNAAVYLRPWED